MKTIALLGGASLFIVGVSFGLLISYPIDQHSIFVCFVALALLLVSGLLGLWAALLDVNRRAWLKSLPLIEYAVQRQLDERELRVVDGP